ncbi:hypothetical protein [Brachybacterium epidermidis]|uniref:hypothetical protein n=1 Tax=Brachybacterium epidermidis TaxID=2781983 RepID=UPI00398F4C4B
MITRQTYDDKGWRSKTARSVGAREFNQVMKRLELKGSAEFVHERMTAKTGRPRVLPWVAFYRLCVLTAFLHEATFHLVDIVHVADWLTPAQKRRVGFTRCDYHHVEYAFKTLANACDETIDPETGEITSRLGMSLDDFMVRVIDTPEKGPTSRQAIDGTLVATDAARRSWGKDFDPEEDYAVPEDLEIPKATSSETGFPRLGEDGLLVHSVDPDARDQVETGKNLSRAHIGLGYELHCLTDTREPGSDLHAPPVIRVPLLRPGSHHRGEGKIAALDALKRVLGFTPEMVLGDRGYSNSRVERWALPLAQRGVKQVFDFHSNNRGGAPGPLPNTIWQDGQLFVADEFKRLAPVKARSPQDTRQTKAERATAVSKRQAFAFGFEDWNFAKGTVRLIGPAVRGQVRCVNYPRTWGLPTEKQHTRGSRRGTRPETIHARGENCSCGKTIVVPIIDVIRFYQPYVWGSQDWERAYGQRSLSETANSLMKTHFARLAKGTFRVLGLRKIGLALAFFLDAVNTRTLLSMPSDFFERWTGSPDPYLPDPDDPSWLDPHHEPPPARAGPEGHAICPFTSHAGVSH